MRRIAPLLLLANLACSLEFFVYGNEPVDEYHWDEVDPNIDGELTDPHPSLVPPQDRFEGFVTADGDEIHYVYARRTGATKTIFYSHGTSRNIGRYWDRLELMWELGYNVMIYDYPGYGRSGGAPDEAGLRASAEAVLAELPEMPGVDMNEVYFVGYSLGGVPTYWLATQTEETGVVPRGVFTEAIFCNIQTLVEEQTYLDLPGEFVSKNQLDNCARIGDVPATVRKLLLHGERDDFIRPVHAERLADRAAPPLQLVWAEGAKHSDIPLVMKDAYGELLQGFIER